MEQVRSRHYVQVGHVCQPQKICDRIDNISMLFRYVLEAVFDVLHLIVFDDTNKSFVSSMMKLFRDI